LIGIILLATACLETDPPPSFQDQLVKDVKAIDDYLAANPAGPNELVIKDASGVRLVISVLGTGTIPPNAANNLKIAYAGRTLPNGSIFDSNDSYLVKLSDGIITGWKIGLSLLTEGAQAKLYIPSGLAYGTTGKGSIPANANLVFDITLIDVVPTAQQESKLTSDIAAIDSYLAANGITAVSHSSGIRYVMTEAGSGTTPTLYDAVKVNFKAKVLTTGEIAYEHSLEPNAEFSSRVVNYPHGGLLGLQLMAEGGKATFYVPSVLANGIPGLPANTNAIFEIELLDVVN